MKPRYAFAIVAVALVLLLRAAPVQADKSYYAERYDVVLDVQSDGALVVAETIRFRFSGGPFTYAFRDLAYTELDEIDRLQASMDGAILPQGTGAGQVEIAAGRPLKVTWHLAPTYDAAHEFLLTYRVQGAVRKESDADVIIWRAIPEDHDYDIAHSTITLRYPASNPPLAAPELAGAVADGESGEGQVHWTATGIGNDESLVITARFAPGSLVEVAPEWQSRQALQQQNMNRALPAGLLAGLITLLAGLGALALLLLREGRTGLPGYALPSAATSPPDAAAPGLAVQLAGGGTPALATLFDLANRGLLRIDETGRGFWGGKRYSLEHVFAAVRLLPHEQGLLDALFEEKDGARRSSLPLSEVSQRLAGRHSRYQDPLRLEMQAAGWIDPRRKAMREGLMAAAVIALLLGGTVMVLGLVIAGANIARGGTEMLPGAVMAGAGGAALVAGVVAIIAGSAFSPLSVEGERAAGAWRSFKAYLHDVARGREAGDGRALFERYLPFAAGFGLGEGWARHFQQQGYTAIPGWFSVLDGTADDFGAIVAVMASTNSSFSAADGGAAAAGASGGGASGAG